MRGGLHAWLTPVPQGLNSNPCLLKGRRERGKKTPTTSHTSPTHKLYTPTTSNNPSDPTFQMGLSPASVKLLPGVACLHFNSLHTSWILSPLHSGLLTSETCFSGHQHLIPNQPTTFHGLTFSFALRRPVLPWFDNLPPSFSLAVHCESPLLLFLSLLTLWYRVFLSWPLKMLPSLWAILSSSQIQLLQLSEGYIGSMLILDLPLKHQTLTSNDLQDNFNFKIIELQVAELRLQISKTRLFSPL